MQKNACVMNHWEKYIFIEQERYAENNYKMCSQARSTWPSKIAHAERYDSVARYSMGRSCALEMRDAA